MFNSKIYGLWSEPQKCWFCTGDGVVFSTSNYPVAVAQRVTVEQDAVRFRYYAGYELEVKRIDQFATEAEK